MGSSNPAAPRWLRLPRTVRSLQAATLEPAYAWILAPGHPLPIISTSKLERLHSAACRCIVMERKTGMRSESAQGHRFSELSPASAVNAVAPDDLRFGRLTEFRCRPPRRSTVAGTNS